MATTRERFDAPGLVAAFDAERQARGLTWTQINSQVRIAPATIRNMAKGPVVEMDGVLGVTAWLGRSVESFYRDPPADPGPPHRRDERMDVRALYAAMDARRAANGMTWREVALEIGRRSGLPIAPAGLTRLRNGGRVDLYHTLAMVEWLDARVARFTRNLGG